MARLDEQALRRWVSYPVYMRGRELFHKDHVLACMVEDGTISGVVQGSSYTRYITAVTWTGRALRARCSCPYDGGVCKHAVALALAAMERGLLKEDRGRQEAPALEAPIVAEPAPPTWEDYLAPVVEPPALVSPESGTDQIVCRVQLGRRGLEVALFRARLGKRGLGKEYPLTAGSYGAYGSVLPGFAAPPYHQLARLLTSQSLYQSISGPMPVPAMWVDACLEILARLPFVFLGDTDQPMQVVNPPLRGCLTFAEESGGLRLTTSFSTTAGEPWVPPPGTRVLRGSRLWLVDGPRFHPVNSSDPPEILAVAGTRQVLIPEEDMSRFVTAYLPRLAARTALQLPPRWAEKLLDDLPPRPVLVIWEEDGDYLCLDLRFAYGDGPAQVRAGAGEGAQAAQSDLVEVASGEGKRWARRDRAAEEAAHGRLATLGLARGADGLYRPRGEEALDFLHDHLPGLAAQWEVYGEEQLDRMRVARAAPRTQARIRSGVDWFDLEMSLDYGEGRLETPDLLPFLRSGARYARLQDGRALRLPEGWRGDAGRLLADLPEPRMVEGRLRLRRWDAALAGAWLEAAEERQADDTWRSLASLLQGFQGIPEAAPPATLEASPRPYQRRGFDWLSFLREHGLHGILADDMGLGKTLQALTLLLAEKESGRAQGPSLVVAPTSVAFNWLDEARRFAPGLRVLPLLGAGRAARFQSLPGYDVALTTYPLLRRDGERLAAQPFHYLILDEAQQIKNPVSQTARVAKLLQARHRLALTGTPLENNLTELWSLFDFLMPGFLGSMDRFQTCYGRPIQEGGDEAALARLKRRVHPFILRRLKGEVAAELPPKVETVLACDLAPAQRRLYQQVLETCRHRVFSEVEEKGLAKSRITILDALLKLRQVCCHPSLLKLPGNRVKVSAKMDVFTDLIGEVVGEGHRVLVFSQFVGMLSLVRQELERQGIAYEYLDGRTRDREERVKRFQDRTDIPVFLISLKAGGTGLNLTGASYVIHLDPWWNPAVEAQATDRAHRIGQDKQVFSYKLITRGTVEEKILALQERKRALAEGLLAADAGLGKSLTREDLEALFQLD